jgi:hypothetical protein
MEFMEENVVINVVFYSEFASSPKIIWLYWLQISFYWWEKYLWVRKYIFLVKVDANPDFYSACIGIFQGNYLQMLFDSLFDVSPHVLGLYCRQIFVY